MISQSWYKVRIALALIFEERVGAPVRLQSEIRRAEQDAGFDALKAAIGAR